MSGPDAYTPKTRTFLDTGVLIKAFCGEEKLALEAFAVIDDPDREFVASDFIKLELLPKPTFNNKKEALDFYNEYLSAVSELLEITPEITTEALTLACNHGLGAIDAIHFQTAITMNVSEFVTTEKPSKAFFKINNPLIKVISIS